MMVRRDANEKETSQESELSDASCASLAGESPVPVGAEAPDSRPRAASESSTSRAGYRKSVKRLKPFSGEQARGPQHEVKPAASTEKQSGSRAAHFTAKATPNAQVSERALGLGGVQGAARVQGEVRNTRDPSALPSSRQGGSYKLMAKSSAAQRESEGLVVPVMVTQNNATGGKGLCFGHARSEGKREGMAAKSGPNNPEARTCVVKVRQPQRELWAGAKRRTTALQGTANGARSDARNRVHGRVRGIVVQAPSRRPSASRVREIRTHGLKGGPTETTAARRKGR